MGPIAAIAFSGMTAAVAKLQASASNLANINDVSAVGGAPGYQPVESVDAAQPGGGVSAATVTLKPASFLAYAPLSPVADVQGMVVAPEIDPIREIGNQIRAGQAYAYSLLAVKAADDTEKAALNLKV